MLEDAGALAHLPKIKEWYGGYNFGGTEIYCPWDVINYLSDYLYGKRIYLNVIGIIQVVIELLELLLINMVIDYKRFYYFIKR